MGCNGLLSWSKPSWICKRLLCPESRYKYTLALELQLQIGWRQPSLLKAMQRILLIFVSQFPSSIFSRLLRVDGGRLCGGYPDCSVDVHLQSIRDIIGTRGRCLHCHRISICLWARHKETIRGRVWIKDLRQMRNCGDIVCSPICNLYVPSSHTFALIAHFLLLYKITLLRRIHYTLPLARISFPCWVTTVSDYISKAKNPLKNKYKSWMNVTGNHFRTITLKISIIR